MRVKVTCRRKRGAWRLGRFWPHNPVVLDVKDWGVEELRADPRLVVEEVDEPVTPPLTSKTPKTEAKTNVSAPKATKKKAKKKAPKKQPPTDAELAKTGKKKVTAPEPDLHSDDDDELLEMLDMATGNPTSGDSGGR